jgi:hypothetical protein
MGRNLHPADQVQWPDAPAPEAYHGLAGEIVQVIEPHSEADPVGLLLQTLLCFGSVIGRTAHFVAESSQHFTNLFLVLVGATSHGRKGSSWAQIRRAYSHIDADWQKKRVQSGLSSGEGFIWAVRDAITEWRTKGEDLVEVEVDPGEKDKRLTVFEAEFASTLRVMSRDGSTLSVLIRQAWDGGTLQSLTKNSRAAATGAHISIVGHISRDELRRELNATEMGNGFANRFLWACVKRSKELPEGGNLTDAELTPVIEKLRRAVAFAKTINQMKRDPGITGVWARIYHELTAGRPGLLGSVTARAEAQTMRLACLYALLDHSPVVRAEHLLAALAVWEYCQASARYIFGDALGDPVGDIILQALRQQPAGLDRTAISALFKGHQQAAKIGRALFLLQELGLATVRHESEVGAGRPREVWFATASLAVRNKRNKRKN